MRHLLVDPSIVAAEALQVLDILESRSESSLGKKAGGCSGGDLPSPASCRSGGVTAKFSEYTDVQSTDKTVAIEIRMWVIGTKCISKSPEIQRIDYAVVIQVGVTEVAKSVAVAVAPLRIRLFNTVVDLVIDAVGI